jgi:hypothetical protein
MHTHTHTHTRTHDWTCYHSDHYTQHAYISVCQPFAKSKRQARPIIKYFDSCVCVWTFWSPHLNVSIRSIPLSSNILQFIGNNFMFTHCFRFAQISFSNLSCNVRIYFHFSVLLWVLIVLLVCFMMFSFLIANRMINHTSCTWNMNIS